MQQAARAIKAKSEADRDGRRLPLRIHVAWALRNREGAPQSLGAAVATLRRPQPEYEIVNDASLEIAGTDRGFAGKGGHDIIAPSDMMDGRVGAIRKALDDAGLSTRRSCPTRRSLLRDFTGRSARRRTRRRSSATGDRTRWTARIFARPCARLRLDLEEGADMIMVKPAMPYLDVIAAARERFEVPLAAYQVSGEYAMIEAAARNGWMIESG